jgi:DNA-binding NtrC family response regulator
VRLVAATNRDLAEAIRRGAFREDLFYRLNVIPIAVPPLRERVEDVPVLTALFLARAAAKLGRPAPEIAPSALSSLLAYPWPGNVRELQNLMERLVVLVPRDHIEAADLPQALRGAPLSSTEKARSRVSTRSSARGSWTCSRPAAATRSSPPPASGSTARRCTRSSSVTAGSYFARA